MAKPNRIWHGNYDGRQQAIVSAPTAKRAAELIGRGGAHRLREYFQAWDESGANHAAALAVTGGTEGIWLARIGRPIGTAQWEPKMPTRQTGDDA